MTKSADQISLGDMIDTRIHRNNEWTLLSNKGICSSIAPAILSANVISFTKFPDLFGKISRQRKIFRELKELRSVFPSCSVNAIKEEVGPLIFSIISNSLIDLGKDGIKKVITLLNQYKISLTAFKANLFDIQTESMIKKYDKINSSIKSALTRRLNEEFKTSVTKKKTKGIK